MATRPGRLGGAQRHTRLVYRSRLARLAGLSLIPLVLVLAACGGSSTGGGVSTSTVVVSSPIATPTAVGYPLKVYFSRFPDTDTNFSAVFPVARISPTPHVEIFAIQLLIAGPTPEERSAGYFSELNSLLNGPSLCSAAPAPTGGPDFTLTLDHKGSTPEVGTATLKFCRAMLIPGEGTDARVKAEINATLLQFPTIKKVVILTKDGQCAFDLRGGTGCLQ
jgi:hypothetical protein